MERGRAGMKGAGRRDTVLGVIGLAIIVANVGHTIWGAITSTATAVTHVCTATHYSIGHNTCLQDDHSMAPHAAGQAYVVTDVPDPTNGVNQYRIVQDSSSGATVNVATMSTDVSDGKHYVVELGPLWGTDGAKITPGSYEIVTDYGGGHSSSYKLTIENPAGPAGPKPSPIGSSTATKG